MGNDLYGFGIMISIYFGERIIRGCRSVQDCGPVLFLSRRMGNRGRIRERNEEMDQNKEEAKHWLNSDKELIYLSTVS